MERAASIRGFRAVALEHAPLCNLVFLRVVPDLELGPAFQERAHATFGALGSAPDAARVWDISVRAILRGLSTGNT